MRATIRDREYQDGSYSNAPDHQPLAASKLASELDTNMNFEHPARAATEYRNALTASKP